MTNPHDDQSSDPIDSDSPPRNLLPTTGRLAGIDYGKARIGIAVCDENQVIASPLEIYHRQGENHEAEYFTGLVQREQLAGFVIGLPVHMSGDESEMSRSVRDFGAWLTHLTRLPIEFIDERYTTAHAREVLNQSKMSGKKRKAQLDKLAAQIILAAFLERR